MMTNLNINPKLIKENLLGFIETEIKQAGFSKAIVNVSGGVDSAVSCFLAAEALGPKNVLALWLPYESSPKEGENHAMEVLSLTGVNTETISITPLVEPMLAQIPESEKVRRGNVMARMRMIIAYDKSAEFDALVIGTSNKTEILLGYSTMYGDSACAINPIGDLYKTQLRQLASYLGVPQAIIDKPPSADLWTGQTDEGELGFTYAEVDRLLYFLIDQRYNPDACIKEGFTPTFVHAVMERIRKSQYKRMLPPMATLTNRTEGYEFPYLINWDT